MEVAQALARVPKSKAVVKYFNGFQWSRCEACGLKCNIEMLSNLFQQLTDGTGQCLGFYCSPFLGLPALILGAAVSSCPFIFLGDEKMESKPHLTLFEKLGVKWVISDRSLSDASLELQQEVVICGTELFVYKNGGLPATYNSIDENYLYGITTSGSTGAPKIVRVPEQSIILNVNDFSRRIGVDSDDVILLGSALTFDPSMVEFFLALLNGASLVIISEDVKRNTKLLFEAMRDGEVTFYQTTPSLFRLWPMGTKRALLGPRSQLKNLVLGGEPFPSEFEVKLWEPSDKIRIYNTYGITEVSCWATLKLVWPCSNWENFVDGRVDIGEPLSSIFLLKESHDSSGLCHMSIGSSSRVCAIEDETFAALRDECVFRRTGDLFEVIDGKCYFRQRTDSSVKRLGKMFNLGLVEEKAKALHLNCAVVKKGPSDDCTAVMFVVGEQNSSELHAQLTSLKRSLSNDHWPDHVEFIETLPVTVHGKLDKAALLDAHSRGRSQSLNKMSFEELWSYFTLGSLTKLCDSNFKQMGFVSSGGNSFNAVLFINSLSDRGFSVNQDLMVLLLKDAPFSECLALFQEVFKGDHHGLETTRSLEDAQSKQNSMVTAASSCPKEIIVTPTSALKGCVWPRRMPNWSNIWDQEVITIQSEWKIDLKKCVDASPLVVMMDGDGQGCQIIIGSHSGIVVVLNDSGEIKAKTQLPDRVEASACLSTDASSFYIGCYDWKLYKVRISDGNVVWEFTTGDMVKCTAVVHENKVFFGSYDKHIYAVNEAGAMVWKREVGPVIVPSLIHKSHIIVGTLTGKIVILDSADGHEYHSFGVGAPIFANLLTVHFDEADSCLLTCPVNGSLEWRKMDDAFTKVHTFNCPGTVFSAPVSINNTDLIIASETTLQYLRPPNCLWSRSFRQRIVATPFVNVKWPLVVESRLVVITIDGELSVLNLNTGEVLCSYRFPGEVFSSPVVVGTNIFVGCRDNYFHCVSVS